MTPQVWIPLVAQGLVPPVWMAWLAFGPRQRQLAWASHVAALGALLLATGTMGLWLALPRWLLAVWLVGWMIAALVGWRRSPGPGTDGRLSRVLTWTRMGLAVLLAAGGMQALLGRIPVDSRSPVQLAFPLPEGTYLVANGGANTAVNAHVHTLDPTPRFAPYRGQSFAVDLVAVGAWGSRTSGLHPSDPARYAIFGRSVLAPCAGEVVAALDGLPDLPVPDRDREQMAGNHVILSCALSPESSGEAGPASAGAAQPAPTETGPASAGAASPAVWVVLGHLRQGSVTVSSGDTVAVGDPLGQVGNSGNTDEPHLHIHAQTPGTTAAPLSGEPLPMLIDGVWLARNQRITRSVDSTPVSMRSHTLWEEAPGRASSDTRRFP